MAAAGLVCAARAMGAKCKCLSIACKGPSVRGDMEDLFNNLVSDVTSCPVLESLVCGKGVPKAPKARARKPARGRQVVPSAQSEVVFNPHEAVRRVVEQCRETRTEKRAAPPLDCDDETLCKYARFTDGAQLKPFEHFLHYVPRLVNVVTVRAPRIEYSGRTSSHALV